MFKNTSWKTIEGWREVRLWIGQVIAPIVGVVMLSPDARNFVKGKFNEAKDWVNGVLHK